MGNAILKTRFCPSPTGLLHLGNMRTALFNALFAKHRSGLFLLRIEDTDKTRSKKHYIDALYADLCWLGLQWNEGPSCDINSVCSSDLQATNLYWQSQRQSIYDTYYQELEAKGLAYPCFCTEQQLALTRKIQISTGKPPRYNGICLNLTAEDIQKKIAQGLKPALRFKVPLNQTTTFHDLVRGKQSFNNNDIGDFIIRRADGTPPFMYCNAIDDALMGVTHALRGEDHLTNTPRQIMMLSALNLPIPTYGHISLIVGSDGAPLSKRHGSRSIQALREEGYLPLAIINYLARLGHHYVQDHWMTLEALAEHFSIHALGSAPARFDLNQLLHWQHETLLRMSDDALWEWMGKLTHALVPNAQRMMFIETIKPNITFPIDAQKWAIRLYTEDWEFGEAERQVLEKTDLTFFQTALRAIEIFDANLDKIVIELKEKLDIKGKALFQPLRVVLTGELHGPELASVMAILGKERIKTRLERACMAFVNQNR